MLNRIKVNTGLGHIDLFLIKVDVHPKKAKQAWCLEGEVCMGVGRVESTLFTMAVTNLV